MENDAWVGDDGLRALAPLVYEECRRIANGYFRSERPCASLQPTLLVHEAWLRLSRSADLRVVDRRHLRALMAITMRRILCEHGGSGHPAEIEISLASDLTTPERISLDLLAVSQAMDALEQHDLRLCRAAVLRIYGGMRFREMAPLLRVQERQARNLYSEAIEWLKRYLAV